MKHQLGIVGLIVGLIAIGIAVFQDAIRVKSFPAPPPDSSFKELVVQARKKLIKDTIRQEGAESQTGPTIEIEPEESHDAVELTYMGLGFGAMIPGVVSWVKEDHIRSFGGVIALGLLAIVIIVLAKLGA